MLSRKCVKQKQQTSDKITSQTSESSMVKWTQAQINRYQDTLDLEDGKVKTEEQITPTHTSIRISDCNRIRQNL